MATQMEMIAGDTSTGSSFDTALLRDISSDQFLERYNTDRFTASILASRMRYVVKHMSTLLQTTAFSIILRDWYDFAATISGPPEMNYPMSTGSDSLLNFMFTMPEGVRNIVEEYGPENIRPGDVILANDPYRVGLHVNDVAFIRPIFYQDRLVSFVSIRAHQLDMGGSVPGGFSVMKQSVYDAGLVVPPTLLYSADKPVRSAFHLIFDNTRFGSLLLPDIKSLYQSLLLGERLLLESIERYGLDAYLGSIRYCCDVAADAMSEAIRTKLPDGVYEGTDALDADGIDDSREYRVKVKIVKVDDRIEFDFSGSSPEARASINCGPLDVKAAVGVALKMLIEHDAPICSGSFRNIDIVIPPHTFCSAAPPTGPIFMFWDPQYMVMFAIYWALAETLGAEAIGGEFGTMMVHNGNGRRKDGSPWLTVATCGGEHGPWGASKVGDGDSYTVNHTANNLDPATESVETDVPMVMMRKEYVTDSGGPGKFRGGAAVLRDTYWLTDSEHYQSTLHVKAPTGRGVYGGGDGTAQACWMFPADQYDVRAERQPLPTDTSIYRRSTPVGGLLNRETKSLDRQGDYFYFGAQSSWRATAGASLRFQTGGGGGWGDPLERDPEAVRRDVRDEYVSIEGARRDYGVVVTGDPLRHPEKLQIDVAATEACRAQIRSARAAG